jgi:outer membrane protein TolC
MPDMMAATPGGLTAEQVGARAGATSYQARAAQETATAATARADAAWANYLPRFGLLGRYTRLSEFTPPSFGSDEVRSVVTPAPDGTLNPSPTVAAATSFRFPLVFNQWLVTASINIPISDYFLRLNQSYSAATHSEEAARFDILGARATSYSNGKLAYFNWLRARGGVTVAAQTLNNARAHQKDAENQFAVGNASKADVLRAQTSVAAAELGVERAKSLVLTTEQQVRVAMHAKDDEKLEPGESLDATLSPAPQNATALISEARGARPEIKSIDRNATAARKLAQVGKAGRYPVVAAFGELTYGNPNPRVFPQTQDWFPTWAAGAQVSWSPNDILTANAQGADYESRAAALEAQQGVVRDGIDLEVNQAHQAVVVADIAIETTTRQLESAEEGYRVARELFNAGRGTSTTVILAETALAQSRFDALNAKVDARIARIRLDHALGRDVK